MLLSTAEKTKTRPGMVHYKSIIMKHVHAKRTHNQRPLVSKKGFTYLDPSGNPPLKLHLTRFDEKNHRSYHCFRELTVPKRKKNLNFDSKTLFWKKHIFLLTER